MRLSGVQAKQLVEALVAAFPNRAALAQMVHFGLSENLDAISPGSNLVDGAHELIKWAEARGRLSELIKAALTQNPSNPDLQAVAEMPTASNNDPSPAQSISSLG